MAILGQAKVGKMRLGAHRLNFYQPSCYATVGGVRCESQLLEASLRISKRANSAAAVQGTTNSAVFRMKTGSVTPVEGKDVKIYCGSTAPQSLLFGGTIQQLAQVYEGEKQANIFFDITAVGYGWLFNRRLIASKTYRRVSASTIILDLVATYASGVTTAHVDLNLPTISVSFTNTALGDALNEIAQLVGSGSAAGRWFLDDTGTAGDLWFFTTDPRMAPEPITGKSTTNPLSNIFKLVRTKDLAQVRTRVIARGGSTTSLLISLPQGASVVPIANTYPFALPAGVTTGGGEVHVPLGIGERLVPLTYTGTQRSGTVSAPSAGRMATCAVTSYANSTGALTANSAYQWGFTYVTSNGETPLSAATISGFVPAGNNTVNLSILGLYDLTNGNLTHVPPDRSVTAINVYRTVANGSQFLFAFQLTTGDEGAGLDWPVIIGDLIADGALGGAPPPATAICPQGVTSTTSTTGAAVGASTITNVVDLTLFEPTGGYAVAGQQVFPYSSVTYTNSGGNHIGGTLTLAAALTGAIRANSDAIKPCPVLTGVTAADVLAPTSIATNPMTGLSGGVTFGTLYNWAATFVTGAGESLPGPLSGTYATGPQTAPTSPSIANSGVNTGPTNGATYSIKAAIKSPLGMLSTESAASGNVVSNGTSFNISVTVPSGTLATNVFIFRTKANGSTYFLCSTLFSATVVGTTYTAEDREADGALGTQDTSFWIQKYTLNAIVTGPAGVTARKIYRNTGPGTALKLVTTIADNTTTTYDDQTADGSLGAAAPTTDTAGVVGLPMIPPSTTIGLYFQADDTAAQSALAALEGGSGIHEAAVSDSSYTTIDTVIAAAQASLALNKTAEASIDVETRDYKMQPGISFTINIGSPTNISGSFRASEITITQVAAKVTGPPYLYPLITARGSTMRWSLADFLWHMKLAADQKL